jgi:hypothetical protein
MATKKKPQRKKQNSAYEFARVATGNKTYGKRQFKRDVKKLVKAGLYKPTVSIDDIVPTKYIASVFKKYGSVLRGTVASMEVNPGEIKKYQKAGYKTKGNRVLVPVQKGETVKRTKNENGVPTYERKPAKGTRGQKKKEKIIPYNDLPSYIENVIFSAPDLGRGEYYGFRYFGNNSLVFFSGDDWGKRRMLERVLHYSSMEDAIANGNAEVEDEIYQNFALVKIVGPKDMVAWEKGVQAQRFRAKQAYREANRERYAEKRRQYLENLTEEQKLERAITRAENRKEDAARKRAARALIARNEPEKLLENRQRDKIRKQKARAKKK